MGEVIRFPIERRQASKCAETQQCKLTAAIFILPVVRIERHAPTAAPKRRAASIRAPMGNGVLRE